MGPGDGVRRAVLTRLPWALASRRRLRRGWVVDPREVWDRWAGADTTWDTSPVHAPPLPTDAPGSGGST